MRLLAIALLLCACACAAPAAAQVAPAPHSVALGHPWDGELLHGVQLPIAGPDWVTWDEVLHRVPNRGSRRWGTEELLAMLQTVAREFGAAHPEAPPLLISDLSRRHGGPFGKRYGGLGHASHQNGRDADVMYPRRDRALLAPTRPAEVDRALAQELVDRFRRAGAVKLYVGPSLHLHGPRKVVVALAHHDDHVHVRIPNPRRPRT